MCTPLIQEGKKNALHTFEFLLQKLMAIIQCFRAPLPNKKKKKKAKTILCCINLNTSHINESCLCWEAQSTAALKQRPSAGGLLPAEWPSGAAHPGHGPSGASSSTEIYDQLQVTRSGVELSQIQHFCSPVTVTLLLCSINCGMRAVPILLGYGVAGQPHQEGAASASPASCTFNFPQNHTFHGKHKGCQHFSLLHVYKPLISLKKGFQFLISACDENFILVATKLKEGHFKYFLRETPTCKKQNPVHFIVSHPSEMQKQQGGLALSGL